MNWRMISILSIILVIVLALFCVILWLNSNKPVEPAIGAENLSEAEKIIGVWDEENSTGFYLFTKEGNLYVIATDTENNTGTMLTTYKYWFENGLMYEEFVTNTEGGYNVPAGWTWSVDLTFIDDDTLTYQMYSQSGNPYTPSTFHRVR